jgi:hypothetical protein
MNTIEILTENGLMLALESGRLAVTPKTKLTDNLRNFIASNKDRIILELRTRKLESLLSSDPDLREQFEFEVSERIAIMIFDGGLSESEAVKQAKESTFQIWLNLFAG